MGGDKKKKSRNKHNNKKAQNVKKEEKPVSGGIDPFLTVSGNRPAAQINNFDYLMSLFDQYDTNKNNKINEFQKQTNQNVRNCLEKVSSGDSRSPSSQSSAANYLQDLIQRRQDHIPQDKVIDGMLESIKSTTGSYNPKADLHSMREKYLNMSGIELEAITPAEMLNITYEFNKMRASGKPDENSSSSSSERNEAGFKIFEEMFKKKQKNGDSSSNQSLIASKHDFHPKPILDNLDSSSSSCSKYKLFESKFLKFFENDNEKSKSEEEIVHPFLEKNNQKIMVAELEALSYSSQSQELYTNQKIDLNLAPKIDNNLDKTQQVFKQSDYAAIQKSHAQISNKTKSINIGKYDATLSNISLRSQSFFNQTEQLNKNLSTSNKLTKLTQNPVIDMMGSCMKCQVCLQNFNESTNLPLKLFCGDTICKFCVQIKENKLECQVCQDSFGISLSPSGYLQFANKYTRIKDKFGSLKSTTISTDLILRSLPVDLLRIPKQPPGTNIVLADPKPLDSDQLPVLSTQIQCHVVKQKNKSIDLDQTKNEINELLRKQSSRSPSEITIGLSDQFQGFYVLQKDPPATRRRRKKQESLSKSTQKYNRNSFSNSKDEESRNTCKTLLNVTEHSAGETKDQINQSQIIQNTKKLSMSNTLDSIDENIACLINSSKSPASPPKIEKEDLTSSYETIIQPPKQLKNRKQFMQQIYEKEREIDQQFYTDLKLITDKEYCMLSMSSSQDSQEHRYYSLQKFSCDRCVAKDQKKDKQSLDFMFRTNQISKNIAFFKCLKCAKKRKIFNYGHFCVKCADKHRHRVIPIRKNPFKII